jgi:diguanylate cyclase (GGDEF)-like protein
MTTLNKLKLIMSYLANTMVANQKLAHRQAKLLSWILLFAIVFSVIILFVVLVFNPHHDPDINRYIIFISGLIIFFIFVYALNHRGYYHTSALLFVISAAIPPWASLLFDPSVFQGDFVPLIYVTVSALISSILLPIYITVALSILQFTGITLVLILSPASASFNWISFLAYVFLISVLSILANSIIQHDMKQLTNLASKLALQKMFLQDQATHDDLTNLFNRRYFVETLKHEVQRGISDKISLGIVIVDIDKFKRVNDTLGHVVGDVVIQGVGNFLASRVRESDVACRYGGDEFILILPNTSREATKERAEQLRIGIQKLNLPIAITISLGIAIFPENGVNGETLLKSADSALYQAKQKGGNCVVMTE